MTGYEEVISLMYELKNKYGGQVTELTLQRKYCTNFMFAEWPFYVKCSEVDFSICVPCRIKNKIDFYLGNKKSIFNFIKNIKSYKYFYKNKEVKLYCNAKNKKILFSIFNEKIIEKLMEFGVFEVIGNKTFKKTDKNINYIALRISTEKIHIEKIIDSLNIVKSMIDNLSDMGYIKSEELYSAQYLFNDYRDKEGNFFLYKRLEDENGGKAISKEEVDFPLGGYKKTISNVEIIIRNREIMTINPRKAYTRITEANANIDIESGFYMNIKLKNPISRYLDGLYNVSLLDDFQNKYCIKSSDSELADKILDDNIKRNIAKIQSGEFYINSFEGISFFCDSDLKEYEQVLSVVRAMEDMIKKINIINKCMIKNNR